MDSRIQIGGSRNGVVQGNKAKVRQGAGNEALKLAGNSTPAAVAA